MSLKAQAHFNTICNVQVIKHHGATQQFGMLIFHAYAPAPPSISTLTTPYASKPLPLTIFMLLHRPHHSLCFCTPASSSPQFTILMLLWGPQVIPPMPPSPPLTPPCTRLILSTTYHPYSCGVPSRHASDAAYHSYACIVPSRHALNSAYHPYACIVPSQHAFDSAYHPYTCSALLTCL
ncbi:hypothetical protein O181_109905 [Austropuccinia psidii MF-1]|uniref:Uncharacterized protein n=1 Tax=Austropuccinia psidii MF-1 TaxID=1389203 RepID=A0A9Q3JZC7_9BASI|nr:hypothetical protein [Austropuccinia psidii MF-1]